MTSIDVSVNLPRPHEKQLEIIKSEHKRKIVCAGRRFGKTTLASIIAVLQILRGKRVLYAAPTDDQTTSFWEAVNEALVKLIGSGLATRNKTKKTIKFQKGHIKAKTAWDADTMRGDYADLLILDEYQLIKSDTLEKVCLPMLADNDGSLVLIFTPNAKNHAYYLFQKATNDEKWLARHFTTKENPHLSEIALRSLSEDMTNSAYRQEILAEFLDIEGKVFRNVDELHSLKPSHPSRHKGHNIVVGADWGKLNDYTVYSFLCVNCSQEVFLHRSNKIEYHTQVEHLKRYCQQWKPRIILAESNSMGEPIIEAIRRIGLPVKPFKTTATSKPQIIENLALIFEQKLIKFINLKAARVEFEVYEFDQNKNTGLPRYGAPDGFNDDTVIARALAVFASNRSRSNVEVIKLNATR